MTCDGKWDLRIANFSEASHQSLLKPSPSSLLIVKGIPEVGTTLATVGFTDFAHAIFFVEIKQKKLCKLMLNALTRRARNMSQMDVSRRGRRWRPLSGSRRGRRRRPLSGSRRGRRRRLLSGGRRGRRRRLLSSSRRGRRRRLLSGIFAGHRTRAAAASTAGRRAISWIDASANSSEVVVCRLFFAVR